MALETGTNAPVYGRLSCLVSIVAVLRGDSNVSGTVTFEQASESAPTTISYDIKGNDPSAQRGMHIHQFGDNTNGCTSAGPHCESLSSINEPHSKLATRETLSNRRMLQRHYYSSRDVWGSKKSYLARETGPCCQGSSPPILLTLYLAVNPFSKQHGAPSDSERHVGDLGNYETDAQGNSKGSITDEYIKLIGQESVLGVCTILEVCMYNSC